MADGSSHTPYQRDLRRSNHRLTDALLKRAYGPDMLHEVTVDFIACHNLTDLYRGYVERRLGSPVAEVADESPAP
jgi:hypothetical protein